MEVVRFDIAGVLKLRPKRWTDDRGYFVEHYKAPAAEGLGLPARFVQDNISLSLNVGTVRGLHYQSPPFAQAKLISVLDGAIRDAVVDVRKGSPTFGKSLTFDLDAEDGWQIYVPAGFLHGFVTRQPRTRVMYKVDALYAQQADGAVFWADPRLGIDWGIDPALAQLSSKDAAAPLFADFDSPFTFEPQAPS